MGIIWHIRGKTEHPTDDLSICIGPMVITDCPPGPAVAHLHPALHVRGSVDQSHLKRSH